MMTFGGFSALAATAGHIVIVQAKLDQLTRVKNESWEQLLTAAARLYRDGTLGVGDLVGLAADMRASYGSGYTLLWEAHMPADPNLSMLRFMAKQVPNGPQGSWQGRFPLSSQPTPPRGVSVVYVIFNAANEPVYVGSTRAFRDRMARHRRDKADSMHSWVAYPCRDRAHAYRMERDLLREYKLRLNRQGTGQAA